ncbi:MAG: hypothetical protein WBF81_06690 [Thermoplasmata archaeon]
MPLFGPRQSNLSPDEDQKAREAAIAAPGPGWKEWFYDSFLKVWVVFAFFLIDVWVVVAWLSPFDSGRVAYAFLSLLGAMYLEYLGYQCLWYEAPELARSSHEVGRPNLVHPVLRGRWTPEWAAAKAGPPPEPGSDPREFL